MFSARFRERAPFRWDGVLNWPGEKRGIGWACYGGVVLGGDVEGEVEEGEGVRCEVG